VVLIDLVNFQFVSYNADISSFAEKQKYVSQYIVPIGRAEYEQQIALTTPGKPVNAGKKWFAVSEPARGGTVQSFATANGKTLYFHH
jgi:hypothetical protein